MKRFDVAGWWKSITRSVPAPILGALASALTAWAVQVDPVAVLVVSSVLLSVAGGKVVYDRLSRKPDDKTLILQDPEDGPEVGRGKKLERVRAEICELGQTMGRVHDDARDLGWTRIDPDVRRRLLKMCGEFRFPPRRALQLWNGEIVRLAVANPALRDGHSPARIRDDQEAKLKAIGDYMSMDESARERALSQMRRYRADVVRGCNTRGHDLVRDL